MNEVKLYVDGVDTFFSTTRSVADRSDVGDLSPQRASITFERMEELLKVLTPRRWALLRRLRETGGSNIRALAQGLSRDYRGVQSDVSILLNAGLICRRADETIFVPWSRITGEMVLDSAA